MRKTTIYLPDATERRMRRLAKRLGVSRAEITRAALEDFLERGERSGALPPSVGMGVKPANVTPRIEIRL